MAQVVTTGLCLSHLKKGRCSRSLKTNGEEICQKKDFVERIIEKDVWNEATLVCVVCRKASLPGMVN